MKVGQVFAAWVVGSKRTYRIKRVQINHVTYSGTLTAWSPNAIPRLSCGFR
jgi:hypothetical protein